MELSGGEKRLVALGAVLVTDPSLLVLDEPYAHLDWDGARMVRRALRNLHGEGRTVIVIEHRHDGLMQDASRCLILQDGRVSWDGPPCAAQGALRRAGLTPAYPRRESPGRRPPEGPPALEISDLSQRISNRDVLREISLTLARGEVVAVIGRNGAGKTTLVRHLNGLLRPRRGAVRVLGRPVDGRDPSEMAAEVGLAFQNPGDQFFKFRVEEELRVSSRALGREDSEWLAELQAILDLGPLLSRSPFRLSEGEKKRVAIASVLAARPSVLVLDEPTVGQDGRFRERLARVVGALRGRGVTTLLVTHDLDFAGAVADRWIVLEGGRVAGQGAPDDPTMAALLQTLGAHWDHGGRRVATLCGGD
jgi:energy-coupling factor transport system ATP-binding protein